MIETERLIIIPLSYEQIIKYAKLDNSLEQELKINKSIRSISTELREAINETILPNLVNHFKCYKYATIWTAISRIEKIMVGDLCIIGDPRENGEIEIGYGTYEEHQGKGFMTEIVNGIITWAQAQLEINTITANTQKTNTASIIVLQKNDFIKINDTKNDYFWKLNILHE